MQTLLGRSTETSVTGASVSHGKLVDQRGKAAKRAKGCKDFGFTVSEVESHQSFQQRVMESDIQKASSGGWFENRMMTQEQKQEYQLGPYCNNSLDQELVMEVAQVVTVCRSILKWCQPDLRTHASLSEANRRRGMITTSILQEIKKKRKRIGSGFKMFPSRLDKSLSSHLQSGITVPNS